MAYTGAMIPEPGANVNDLFATQQRTRAAVESTTALDAPRSTPREVC